MVFLKKKNFQIHTRRKLRRVSSLYRRPLMSYAVMAPPMLLAQQYLQHSQARRPLLGTPLQVGVRLLTHCICYSSRLDMYLLWIFVSRWESADTASWSDPDNWQKLLWRPEAAGGVNIRFSACLKHTRETFLHFFSFNYLVPFWFDHRVDCSWSISCKVLSLVMLYVRLAVWNAVVFSFSV